MVLPVCMFACGIARADRCIAYSSNMHTCIPFQLGASEVAIYCNLPVALGVLPDFIHRRDVLQSTLTVEISHSKSGNTGGGGSHTVRWIWVPQQVHECMRLHT